MALFCAFSGAFEEAHSDSLRGYEFVLRKNWLDIDTAKTAVRRVLKSLYY